MNAIKKEVSPMVKCNPLAVCAITSLAIAVIKKQAENKASSINRMFSTAIINSNNPTMIMANVSRTIGGIATAIIFEVASPMREPAIIEQITLIAVGLALIIDRLSRTLLLLDNPSNVVRTAVSDK